MYVNHYAERIVRDLADHLGKSVSDAIVEVFTYYIEQEGLGVLLDGEERGISEGD